MPLLTTSIPYKGKILSKTNCIVVIAYRVVLTITIVCVSYKFTVKNN